MDHFAVKKIARGFAYAAVFLLCVVRWALAGQVYNVWGPPAVGSIVVYNGTYIFEAATIATIYNLWPCAGMAEAMLADGTCVALTSGTVTSVALSMPGIFSVAGSPITSAGTLDVTLASETENQVWASPDGAAGSPIFRSLVNADFPTSGVTAGSYTSADITVNAQGIVTAASDGSSSGCTFAAPSTLVTLSSSAGSASTCLRSDAGLELDQSIAPTMTGKWIFTPSTGGAIVINGTSSASSAALIVNGGSGDDGAQFVGAANQWALRATGASTTGQSDGLVVSGGTNSSDVAFRVNVNPNSLVTAYQVLGNGHVQIYPQATGTQWLLTSDNSATTPTADIEVTRNSSTANQIGEGPDIDLQDISVPTATTLQNSGGQSELWQYNGGWVQVQKFDTSDHPYFPHLALADTGDYVCYNSSTGELDYETTCTVSSIRDKARVTALAGALREVMALHPVQFYYRAPFAASRPGPQVGLIAEQVLPLDRRLVAFNAKGQPASVYYENLTAVLAGAIQTQQKEIEALWAALATTFALSALALWRTRARAS